MGAGRKIRCSCGSTNLTAYCFEVREWYPRSGGWENTGEIGKRWIVCKDCGKSWTTRRSIEDLERIKEGVD